MDPQRHGIYRYSLYLDENIRKEIKQLAAENNKTMTDMIVEMVGHFMANPDTEIRQTERDENAHIVRIELRLYDRENEALEEYSKKIKMSPTKTVEAAVLKYLDEHSKNTISPSVKTSQGERSTQKTIMGVYIPLELKQKARIIATKEGMSLSGYLSKIIIDYFDSFEENE